MIQLRFNRKFNMSVTAKFRVHNITSFNDASGKSAGSRVAMSPVYDPNPDSENGKFYQATPWGEIILGTVNPTVAEQLPVGSEVLVTFEKVA